MFALQPAPFQLHRSAIVIAAGYCVIAFYVFASVSGLWTQKAIGGNDCQAGSVWRHGCLNNPTNWPFQQLSLSRQSHCACEPVFVYLSLICFRFRCAFGGSARASEHEIATEWPAQFDWSSGNTSNIDPSLARHCTASITLIACANKHFVLSPDRVRPM